ncbi:glycosyltransferase [Maritalea sp. P4.10X]|uniref:Glycosyltransferase n=2 Tax=Maritalea mediterranea TaxID=2909667 RepID=A0ABS9E879_9HYPH|nr:glycosyltransferase [Maritalea mediterranea]
MSSVEDQSHNRIEHVIQDGGSVDNTETVIAEKLHPNVSYERMPDKGIYEGINNAIVRCRGDVIGLLHSDDVFAYSNVVEDVMTLFRSSDIDVVYSDLSLGVFLEDGSFKVVRKWKSEEFHPRLLRMGWVPPHPTLFIKRSIFDRVGFYNSNYRISGDFDFMLRLFNLTGLKFKYLPTETIHMSLGGTSTRAFYTELIKLSEDFEISNKHGLPLSGLLLKKLRKLQQFI